jgi:hypothetical protein
MKHVCNEEEATFQRHVESFAKIVSTPWLRKLCSHTDLAALDEAVRNNQELLQQMLKEQA